jgi:hypothetical protein
LRTATGEVQQPAEAVPFVFRREGPHATHRNSTSSFVQNGLTSKKLGMEGGQCPVWQKTGGWHRLRLVVADEARSPRASCHKFQQPYRRSDALKASLTAREPESRLGGRPPRGVFRSGRILRLFERLSRRATNRSLCSTSICGQSKARGPGRPRQHKRFNQHERWPERLGRPLAVTQRGTDCGIESLILQKMLRMTTPYNWLLVVIIGTSPHSEAVRGFVAAGANR